MFGFNYVDQLGQERVFTERDDWLSLALLHCFANSFDNAINIAVSSDEEPALLLRCDVGYVARCWTNVKCWRTDRHDVVDLARVNDPDKLVAHHDRMQIRR